MNDCQICGATGETRNVVLRQNIGMLISRQTKTVEGELCKDCIDHFFREYTQTTLIWGWWGMISLLVAPFDIASNVAFYLLSSNMHSRQTDKRSPTEKQVVEVISKSLRQGIALEKAWALLVAAGLESERAGLALTQLARRLGGYSRCPSCRATHLRYFRQCPDCKGVVW